MHLPGSASVHVPGPTVSTMHRMGLWVVPAGELVPLPRAVAAHSWRSGRSPDPPVSWPGDRPRCCACAFGHVRLTDAGASRLLLSLMVRRRTSCPPNAGEQAEHVSGDGSPSGPREGRSGWALARVCGVAGEAHKATYDAVLPIYASAVQGACRQAEAPSVTYAPHRHHRVIPLLHDTQLHEHQPGSLLLHDIAKEGAPRRQRHPSSGASVYPIRRSRTRWARCCGEDFPYWLKRGFAAGRGLRPRPCRACGLAAVPGAAGPVGRRHARAAPGPMPGSCSQVSGSSPPTALRTAGARACLALVSPSSDRRLASPSHTRVVKSRTGIAAGHLPAPNRRVTAQTRMVASAGGLSHSRSWTQNGHMTTPSDPSDWAKLTPFVLQTPLMPTLTRSHRRS